MAKLKTSQPPALAVAHTRNEGRQHRGADSPGQMKPRHRIAMAAGVAAAAFGPARHREKAQAARTQPRPLLSCRKATKAHSPTAWPVTPLAIESAGAEPVLQCQGMRIADADPALLGSV